MYVLGGIGTAEVIGSFATAFEKKEFRAEVVAALGENARSVFSIQSFRVASERRGFEAETKALRCLLFPK
jgi:hypothetical protein